MDLVSWAIASVAQETKSKENTHNGERGYKVNKKLLVVAIAAMLPVAMMSAASGADTNPLVPINLVAPAGIPDVAPLPFTANKSAVFKIPEVMTNLVVTPQQGTVAKDLTVSGTGLAANTQYMLTWGTSEGTWITDIQPNSINYLGVKYTKFNVDMGAVTTDAAGAFTFTSKVPSDFGGVHDIYAVKDGVAVAHGGFQMTRTVSISPKSGPIGTPVTITYTGMGASLYTAGAAVHWDNGYAGEMQALWTRGTAKVVVRASGELGDHFVVVKDAITFQYLNVLQSPVPFANGGVGKFTITKGTPSTKPYMVLPKNYTPTVSQRTTLSDAGLDPNTKAVATLSTDRGHVLTKTTFSATGLTSTGTHQLVWASVVGNRVNCTGTCWAYNSIPLATVNVTGSSVSQEVTIPDHLGGWHVIQLKQGDKIEAQASFYVQESIVKFLDKSGKVITEGIAKADTSGSAASIAKGGAGTPTYKFKAGEEITISMRGIGWTQLDNTRAVTYDNNYIGYGCGFNSNGFMVIHITATGKPGFHTIDLHPLLYTQQPSFANTPYGMVPILSSDRDFAGLALGYQLPSVHFMIEVVK